MDSRRSGVHFSIRESWIRVVGSVFDKVPPETSLVTIRKEPYS